MRAVIRTSGRQYSVEPGQVIEVDRLPASVGDKVTFDEVLLTSDGEDIKVGSPTIPGAEAVGEVLAHSRSRKVIVFKYKPKNRYRRKSSQRQHLTRVRIDKIVV